MFKVGDKVEFVDYPNLKGVVRGILPATDDLPETISVDMFIPAGEPGFTYTGIPENFWCGPDDLRANTGLQSDGGKVSVSQAFSNPLKLSALWAAYWQARRR